MENDHETEAKSCFSITSINFSAPFSLIFAVKNTLYLVLAATPNSKLLVFRSLLQGHWHPDAGLWHPVVLS